MEFKFKRKYTGIFIFAIILHVALLSFWLFYPTTQNFTQSSKNTISLLALINCELIIIFYLGLFRKKYFAYYDKLLIKRSFFKNVTINYSTIQRIDEKSADTILLNFGLRPSFTIWHTKPNGRTKKTIVRSDNSELLLKVIKSEIDISKIK